MARGGAGAASLRLALSRRLGAPRLGPDRLSSGDQREYRALRRQLAAFARQVGASPTKQIVLVLDRAGWHTSLRLRVPEHVHLLFLPPYSPELQPAEHLLGSLGP
jgi:transposase